MNIDKEKYVTGKKVEFFPYDISRKYGYIRDVDELGFTYEVTEAERDIDLGMFFRNHALGFTFKEV